MDRRALLRTLAVAGGAAAAGCLGGRGSAAPGYEDLTVEEFDAFAGDDGNLVVTVTVANTASEARSGTLYVNVDAGGSVDTRVRRADVGPAGTQGFRVPFDVPMETFNDGGSLSFDFGEA